MTKVILPDPNRQSLPLVWRLVHGWIITSSSTRNVRLNAVCLAS
jgi:hypothetical protein